MAMTNLQAHCAECDDENGIFICRGCSKIFSSTHLKKHEDEIQEEFHQIEDNYNQFQQNITDQKNDLNQHSLIQKINQWENDSHKKIKQIADECRQKLIPFLNQYIVEMKNKFEDLLKQLKQINKDNKYNEIHLNQLKDKLYKLQEEFDQPSNVSIKEEKFEFIDKINLVISPIRKDTKWKQHAITVAGENGQGSQLNQLNGPRGICIDDDQTIYIAEYDNHRIIEWKSNETNGRIVAGGNGQGCQLNQLNKPIDVIIDKRKNSLIISDFGNRRIVEWSLENNTNDGQMFISNIDCFGLTIDKNGDIYVSDDKKHEVRRWKRGEKEGTLVAGGNGQGDQLNQLNSPAFIFVDDNLSLYVSDWGNHRVIKWMKDATEGIVVAGGNGRGSSLTQLSNPWELIVDQLGRIYVADFGNARVIRWCEGDTAGTIVVGRNGQENKSSQLFYPNGLSLDQQGNLYVSDYKQHQIVKFEID